MEGKANTAPRIIGVRYPLVFIAVLKQQWNRRWLTRTASRGRGK